MTGSVVEPTVDRSLVPQRVAAESPQGRFAEGAAAIDGQVVDAIDAQGKHLFYRFDNNLTVHVHLGLLGKFRLQTPPFPEPSPNARHLVSTDDERRGSESAIGADRKGTARPEGNRRAG